MTKIIFKSDNLINFTILKKKQSKIQITKVE